MHHEILFHLEERGVPGDTGNYFFGGEHEYETISYDEWQWLKSATNDTDHDPWDLPHHVFMVYMKMFRGKEETGPDLVDLILEDKDAL